MTLLHPHPALKAISEQASPADQWMNDDDHRYGALRESYAFEYAVLRAGRQEQEHALRLRRPTTPIPGISTLGPLSNINAQIPARLDSLLERHRRAPGLRRVLEERGVGHASSMASTVPNLNVAGFWDQEDPWGPWQIFRHAERARSRTTPTSWSPVRGFTASGTRPKADSIGLIPFGGHETAREFRENDRGAVLPLLSARQGREAGVAGVDVPDRIEPLAAPTRRGRQGRRRPTNLYLHADGTLSFDAPAGARRRRIASTSPIRRTRCRIASVRSRRPIRPATGARGRWRISGSSTDRPDVLTWVSAPLDRDLTVTGELAANLFASTSGTDTDFVVKLIDVYPGERAAERLGRRRRARSPGQYAQSLNGYELPIAMEVRRGRYQHELRASAAARRRTRRSSGRSRCATTTTCS